MFVNLQLVVFMQYARFLLSHKANAISGGSRPWAKFGGGGGLPLTLPPFLPSVILPFFFLPKIRGGGGGLNYPRSITAHITNTIYVREWMLEIWIMRYVCGLFRPFPGTYLLETRARLSQPKEKISSIFFFLLWGHRRSVIRTSEECYSDIGGVLFDR